MGQETACCHTRRFRMRWYGDLDHQRAMELPAHDDDRANSRGRLDHPLVKDVT